MGGEDDNLNASLAHIVLCCVAGRGISRMSGKSFTHPGMHANFFIHGVLGFLHYQSKIFYVYQLLYRDDFYVVGEYLRLKTKIQENNIYVYTVWVFTISTYAKKIRYLPENLGR